jgi:hemerythrin
VLEHATTINIVMNKLLVWDESLVTGIIEIDQQHEKFVELLNDFYQALQNNDIIDRQLFYIDKFLLHSSLHFITEERLMLNSHYPDYDIHRELHDSFDYEVEQLRTVLQYRDKSLNHFLNIVDWLMLHIAHTDMTFAEYYRNYISNHNAGGNGNC